MANDLAWNAAATRRAGGRWLALLRDPWVVLLLALAALGSAWALTDSAPAAVRHLWHWSPALLRGLGMNVQISVLAMTLGTALGLVVGALSLSPSTLLRRLMRVYVLAFRNAPILVLVYFTTYVFPFELNLGGWNLPFPDWIKVVIGLGLPASANVAEIFRGAIQSIPGAQWEAAQSLALRRAQIFRMIVLPQCVRRMLPSWMNLYASITMSTSLASLVGVHDLVDTATVASNTVARSDFTVLVYFTLLALFFAYCYPIARWTRHLERRYAHH
ncbi:MAG: amino acid ABC transporter permease [Achromobacter sp.]|uniref:amino acid ABC transporter permease n=1 Tax=Achromobacter sp. TaxID=134375 RepID=UPI003CFFE27C